MKKIILFLLVTFLFSSCSTTKFQRDESMLIIGTFNMEWLGDGVDDRVSRSEYDYKRLADIIKDTHIDVIGLQEVENDIAVERIMKYLPGYKYIIGNTGYIQNPAIIYRDTVKILSYDNYKPLDVQSGRTRAGLALTVKKGNFDFNMMIVHFKSTSRYDSTDELRNLSFEYRKMQSAVLKNWADSISNNTNEKDIILLGDFNDNPKRSNTNLSPILFGNNYLFISENLRSCKNPNWDNIDHIVLNRSSFARFVQGSVYTYDFTAKYEDYEIEKISDHCPVLCRFNISEPDND